jgi:hypothetical protein
MDMRESIREGWERDMLTLVKRMGDFSGVEKCSGTVCVGRSVKLDAYQF